ncbi:MAG: hypothetical protein BWZ09_02584 [Alphaproteobacteria bacterium ADurb.BinA305]|nr:MAG: hypothetical protein BWZ09_02584 [Alphaproteobacteria bacterium ADurb.BinA305]
MPAAPRAPGNAALALAAILRRDRQPARRKKTPRQPPDHLRRPDLAPAHRAARRHHRPATRRPPARALQDRPHRRIAGHRRPPVRDFRKHLRPRRRRPPAHPDRRPEAGHLRLPWRRSRHLPQSPKPGRAQRRATRLQPHQNLPRAADARLRRQRGLRAARCVSQSRPPLHARLLRSEKRRPRPAPRRPARRCTSRSLARARLAAGGLRQRPTPTRRDHHARRRHDPRPARPTLRPARHHQARIRAGARRAQRHRRPHQLQPRRRRDGRRPAPARHPRRALGVERRARHRGGRRTGAPAPRHPATAPRRSALRRAHLAPLRVFLPGHPAHPRNARGRRGLVETFPGLVARVGAKRRRRALRRDRARALHRALPRTDRDRRAPRRQFPPAHRPVATSRPHRGAPPRPPVALAQPGNPARHRRHQRRDPPDASRKRRARRAHRHDAQVQGPRVQTRLLPVPRLRQSQGARRHPGPARRHRQRRRHAFQPRALRG